LERHHGTVNLLEVFVLNLGPEYPNGGVRRLCSVVEAWKEPLAVELPVLLFADLLRVWFHSIAE
jgi:hypothetical protein